MTTEGHPPENTDEESEEKRIAREKKETFTQLKTLFPEKYAWSFLYSERQPRYRFETFRQLQRFIKDELKFSENQESDLFAHSLQKFNALNERILELQEQTDIETAEGKLETIIVNLNDLEKDSQVIFRRDTSKIKFLLELEQTDPSLANRILPKTNNKTLAFLYHNRQGRQEQVDLTPDAITMLWNFYENKTNTLVKEERKQFQALLGEIEDTRDQFISETDNIKSQSELAIQQLKEKHTKELDEQKEKFKKQFDDQDETASNLTKDIVLWYEKTKKTGTTLTTTYEQKLTLKAPAKYWENLVKFYQGRGAMWSQITGVYFIAIAISLSYLIYHLPPALIEEWSLSKLQAVLFLFTLVSATFMLGRLLVKFTTSAYHLERDAKERWVLTLYYLALLKENAIKPEERDVILRALFARSDTGLLRVDQGIKIPSPDQIIRQANQN